MANEWIMDEMQTVDLRDKRLERRLVSLLASRAPCARHCYRIIQR